MENSQFLVRTICLTYNHELYVEDALRGFALQQTTFPVVSIIIDDASTDHTVDILNRFLKEHFVSDVSKGSFDKETDYGHVTFARHKDNPNCFFAVICLKENHYSKGKSKYPYYKEWANTRYVALCEGDDYWIDPYKLQKQVDFMEQHPDYVACFHNARVQYKDRVNLFNALEESHYPSTEDIIKRKWFIATPSLLYRNMDLKYPDWSSKVVNGDYLLELLLAKEGRFYYMDDVMSVYRQEGQGLSAVLKKNSVNMVDRLIDLLNKMKSFYNGEYASAFDDSIKNYQRIREEYAREAFYENHPIARLFRPKTYIRLIKKRLRRAVQ